MKYFSNLRKLKNKIHIKHLFLAAILAVQPLLIQVPTASAAPTISNYPISSSYYKPGAMTVAGGDLWYLQSSTSSGSIDSIGRMTTSGAVTNYSLGITASQEVRLTTGPDGNIWFIYLATIRKLDISTGVVTSYGGGSSYNTGSIASGSDGKIYFSYKYSGGPADSYLMSLDPTTGAMSTVQTYSAPTVIGGLTSGPDGRLYYGVSSPGSPAATIIARSLSGGTNSAFPFSTYTGNLASGSDGNIWFTLGGAKFVKMTPAGVTTEYDMPTGVHVSRMTSGPDGAIWFVDDNPSVPKIGRITLTGIVTLYTIPGTSVSYEVDGPVLGPDGAMWFSYRDSAGKYIGRITTNPTFSNYPVSSAYYKPGAMTVAGGDLWYLQRSSPSGSIDSIGRMTASGAVTNYSLGLSATSEVRITTGPDGNIWFIHLAAIRKLDISTGAITTYNGGSTYSTGSITSGSDGKIYFSYKYSGGPADSYLKSLDPATGTISTVQTYSAPTVIGGLASGPDGRLYYGVSSPGSPSVTVIARSLSGGANNAVTFSTYAGNIASGSDGNIWFSLGTTKIVKMTPAGAVTEYNIPAGIHVSRMTAGSDGAMWFVDDTPSAPKIGRITFAGVVTLYTIPGTSVSYEVGGPILGPDGAIWFTYRDSVGKYVGRLGY